MFTRPKLAFTLHPVEPMTAEEVLRYQKEQPEAAAKIDEVLSDVYNEFPELRPRSATPEEADEDADLKYGDAVQYLLEYREIPYDRRPECSEELLRVLNRYANPKKEG